MRIAYVGNFEPPFSTENEYRDAYERLGHTVLPYQEGPAGFRHLIHDLNYGDRPDFILWTRTKGLADQAGDALQWEMLRTAGRRNIPVIGVHLDIWIGLGRERQIHTDPYFRGVDLLMTADGGHQDEWADAGVNHEWLLPAISERWLGIGEPREEYRSKVAFVGSWDGGYHREAKHRHELVAWLDKTYGDDVKFWPKRGQHAIRGRELNDLYASVDVVAGDSYLSPAGRYLSDRTPESAGRGAWLVHPYVDGVNREPDDPFTACCACWEAGDWDGLRTIIEAALDKGEDRRRVDREIAVEHIASAHTYTHRAQTIIDVATAQGLL